MQTEFGTVGSGSTFGAHREWLGASGAKLVLALAAGAMHTAAPESALIVCDLPLRSALHNLYFPRESPEIH